MCNCNLYFVIQKIIFPINVYLVSEIFRESKMSTRKVCYYYDNDVGNYYYGQGKFFKVLFYQTGLFDFFS